MKFLTIIALATIAQAAPLRSRASYAEIRYTSATQPDGSLVCKEVVRSNSGPSSFSEQLNCPGACPWDDLKAKYGERLIFDANAPSNAQTATLPFGGSADYTCQGTPGPVEDTTDGYDPTTDPSCQAPKGDQFWFAQSGWVVQKDATLDAWLVTKRVDETTVACMSRDSTNCIWVNNYACAGQLSSSSDSSAPYLDSVRHEQIYGITGNEDPNHWIYRAKQFFNVPI
jgi:hypothetical protein